MNLKKRLRHLASKADVPRDYGKTDVIAKACKELDGIFLCDLGVHAKDIEKRFGIVAKSMDTNLDQLRGPFFFDHRAIRKLLNRAADKIESMEENEAHYQMLKEENERLVKELQDAGYDSEELS